MTEKNLLNEASLNRHEEEKKAISHIDLIASLIRETSQFINCRETFLTSLFIIFHTIFSGWNHSIFRRDRQ
jgi:hypothetical protein